CKDYQGNYVQVNSSLLDESIQNLYNFNLNPLCLWVNRTGLVKADESPDTLNSSKFLANDSCYNFETSSHECEVLDRRLARINDLKSLKEVGTALQEHFEYWTSLR
ncbi:unnamed protein product, partial [Porites lobata]